MKVLEKLWKSQLKEVKTLMPKTKAIGPIKILGMPPMWQLTGLRIFTSIDHIEWYHVSYSNPDRIPTHEETVIIRNNFFRPDSLVVAIFPPISEYINQHPRTLHLFC
jgi:hypothetical protein